MTPQKKQLGSLATHVKENEDNKDDSIPCMSLINGSDRSSKEIHKYVKAEDGFVSRKGE